MGSARDSICLPAYLCGFVGYPRCLQVSSLAYSIPSSQRAQLAVVRPALEARASKTLVLTHHFGNNLYFVYIRLVIVAWNAGNITLSSHRLVIFQGWHI